MCNFPWICGKFSSMTQGTKTELFMLRLDSFGCKFSQSNGAGLGAKPRRHSQLGIGLVFRLDNRPTGMYAGQAAPIDIDDVPVDDELFNNVAAVLSGVCGID
jgi:hypothetical protein